MTTSTNADLNKIHINRKRLRAPRSVVACRLSRSSKNNANTSPKLQTYIEKDPIGPSKRLRAPRSAVACRLSPFSRNNALTSPLYKSI